MVLVQLARIHALSYHMIEIYEGGLERFKKDYWTLNCEQWCNTETQEMKEMMSLMFDSTFSNYLAILDKYLDDKELLAKLHEFNKVREKTVDAMQLPSKGGFNCLLHNDAWCNNIMYR